MATIVYLDADDEITSAASRIRIADEKRIALVVPYGSRLATSRINFRLLAREAQGRGHRLSVVAGDAATRALAASAGLPVFGSVHEYEEAETARPATESAGVATAEPDTEPPARRRKAPSSRNGAAGAAGAAGAGLGAAVATRGDAASPDLEATQAVPIADTSAGRRRGPGGDSAAIGSGAGTGAGAGAVAGAGSVVGAGSVAGPGAGTRTFRLGSRRFAWRYGQAGAIVAAGLISLGLLAFAVGAFVLLPSARAVVALQLERIGPVPMSIRADPSATSPDPESGVIPAQRLTFDVAASGLFPASGRRVEESPARGEVTFLSKNPVDENNIGAGSIVSTPNGIAFRTAQRITIPKATIVGLTVIPGEASVAIEAVEPGPEGNVGAQAITVIPSNEDPTFTEVRNPAATSGGSREEFPLVEQADVDAAMAQLTTQLDAEFARILADAGRIPPGLTVFADSRTLGDPLPTTELATLVGQEGADFALGLATTGSVTAVDPRPVEAVAGARIGASVGPGYRLVDGSVAVTPGEPEVRGEIVSFPVSATASQVRVLDASTLRDEIKGKPIAEARAILDQYGEVELSVWPEWVSAIPTIDARLDVRVELPDGVGEPGPTASPPASPLAPSTAPPTASPTAPPSVVPSGSAVTGPAASRVPFGSPDPGLDGESPPP